VKKVAQKFGLIMYMYDFLNNVQSNQSPKWRKLAQSGHSGAGPNNNKVKTVLGKKLGANFIKLNQFKSVSMYVKKN
jgi:hypothetical protein